jgi:hypothetical protein
MIAIRKKSIHLSDLGVNAEMIKTMKIVLFGVNWVMQYKHLLL